ncbi:hypothetical protein MUP29_05820 [bacterium]|nr:hypothetical protein [bacterium]
MSRKPRLEFPGAIYHINHRGNHQERIRTVLDMKNSLGPIPRNQRILAKPELKELFNGNEEGNLDTRNKIIQDAFKLYAYTQSDVAAFLYLSRSAISKIICKTK